MINPTKKLSRITFKTGYDKFGRRKQFNHAEGGSAVTMWRWKHTPGSVVSRDNFQAVDSLDGKKFVPPSPSLALLVVLTPSPPRYFYFYDESANNQYTPVFDSEHPGRYPTPHPPLSVVYIGSRFPSPPRGLLPGDDTEIPHYSHTPPPACPRPKVHAIKLCRDACTFIHGVNNCPGRTCKMHGHIPVKELPFYSKPPPPVEVDTGPEEVLFDFSGTIFEPRNKQCDAKDYYNGDKVYRRSFEHDWGRGTDTKRFSKFITLSDIRVKRGEAKVQEVVLELKKAMKKQYVQWEKGGGGRGGRH
jgi:hypothetical protein